MVGFFLKSIAGNLKMINQPRCSSTDYMFAMCLCGDLPYSNASATQCSKETSLTSGFLACWWMQLQCEEHKESCARWHMPL